MKLNRSTLRRLIKEEMTREVEAAQMDETVGGHGSVAGRAAADKNFEAAVETLMQLMGATREAAAAAVTSLRGGGQAGDTWHGGLNVGSPDAKLPGVVQGEGAIAEAGYVADNEGRMPQGWLMFLMGELGLDVYKSIADGMDRSNYAERLINVGREDLVQAVQRIPESDESEGATLDETEMTMTPDNSTVTHSTDGGKTFSKMQPARESIDLPGSLLEVLEDRIENLSENISEDESIGGFCGDRLSELSGIVED